MSTLAVGTVLPTVGFDVTRADLAEYAAASGDPNPIHLDPEVARAVGLPDTIAHGMLTLALAARAVSDWTDDGEVVELGGRFTGMVVVPEEGTRIELGGEVTAASDDTVTITLTATCAGVKVLGRPTAVVRA